MYNICSQTYVYLPCSSKDTVILNMSQLSTVNLPLLIVLITII